MRLHTFGDSHSYSGWEEIHHKNLIPGLDISLHLLGPKLMYSFGRDKLDLLNIRNHGVQEGDIVAFCFGEIDCRCHIYKFKHLEYQKVIKEIVDNYIDAIKVNVEQYQNLITCVYNVVPPSRKDDIWKEPRWRNYDFPHLGTDEERRDYHQYINKCLKKRCEEVGYIFVDIYEHHENENGFITNSDGTLHVGTGKFLRQFLLDNVLKDLK